MHLCAFTCWQVVALPRYRYCMSHVDTYKRVRVLCVTIFEKRTSQKGVFSRDL